MPEAIITPQSREHPWLRTDGEPRMDYRCKSKAHQPQIDQQHRASERRQRARVNDSSTRKSQTESRDGGADRGAVTPLEKGSDICLHRRWGPKNQSYAIRRPVTTMMARSTRESAPASRARGGGVIAPPWQAHGRHSGNVRHLLR